MTYYELALFAISVANDPELLVKWGAENKAKLQDLPKWELETVRKEYAAKMKELKCQDH